MKAIQFSRFGGPEVLELVELADPHPAPGQVRVAVRAAGNTPIDWKVRSGAMGGDLPQTTGREVAGVVDEVGEGVADTKPGDDAALDVAGGGALPALVELTGSPDRVVTIADFLGAQETGATFSGGMGTDRAVHAQSEIGDLIEARKFSLTVTQTFPLERIAEAHELSQRGHVRGKLVLLVD